MASLSKKNQYAVKIRYAKLALFFSYLTYNAAFDCTQNPFGRKCRTLIAWNVTELSISFTFETGYYC